MLRSFQKFAKSRVDSAIRTLSFSQPRLHSPNCIIEDPNCSVLQYATSVVHGQNQEKEKIRLI